MLDSEPVARPRTALVTGAGSGIGRATCLALARAGMRVVLAGRRREALEAVAQEAGGMTVLPCDVTTEQGVAALAQSVAEGLDLLVHSAAIYSADRLAGGPGPAWDAMLNVNLRAPLRLSAACLPGLRRRAGMIVFINSSAGLEGTQAPGLYALSKTGLRAAANALRQEVNPLGIRVLSIFPGRTDTPMQHTLLAAEGRNPFDVPMLRAEDVAAMILAAAALPRSAEVTEIAIRPVLPQKPNAH